MVATVGNATYVTVPLIAVGKDDIRTVIGTATVDVALMKTKVDIDGKGLPLTEVTAVHFKFEAD